MNETSTKIRLLKMWQVQMVVIVLAGLLGYANTLHVPFIFDDSRIIIENNQIKNLALFWPPSGSRWFANLTFALNYKLGGLAVAGYHVVNLIIHLLSALLVRAFIRLTLSMPRFVTPEGAVPLSESYWYLPLTTALLFVAHPLQTQAVTYISQRYTSLATLLYLAALFCYGKSRLDGSIRGFGNMCWYGGALLSALLAMKSKEIAFTLPVILIFFEYTFLPGRSLAERLRWLAPHLLLLLVIPLSLLNIGAGGSATVATTAADISRHDYLLTQFRVIVTYLRLLVLPVNQLIDYDFPVSHSVTSDVALSGGLLLVLFSSSLISLRKGMKRGAPLAALAGFGGIWFFITLSVESSVIPISDVIFEHRLYLPSCGAFLVAAGAVAQILGRLDSRSRMAGRVVGWAMVVILCLLVTATFMRNRVWRSAETLWQDVVDKAPTNVRAHAMVGRFMVADRRYEQAISHFQEAVRRKPDYVDGIISLGNALIESGRLDEGFLQYQRALAIGRMDFETRAQLFMNIGSYHLRKREFDQAIFKYQEALAITPDDAMIYHNLGLAYRGRGDLAEAQAALTRARQLNPDLF